MADSLTANEMLAEARRMLGQDRSYAWLRLLIAEGLLDRPQARAIRGRRGGREPGTWPTAQRELFGDLLAELHRGAKRPELCNIVVGRWIERGPAYAPARQARRALRTYRDAAHQRRRTRTLGLRLAELFEAEPETMARSMRKRFADAFEAAVHDRFVDRDSLRSNAFSEQVGRSEFGQWLGPQGLIVALEALASGSGAIETATDETLEASRHLYRLTAAQLARRATELTAEEQLGQLIDSDPMAVVRRNACGLLIAMLGIVSQPDKFTNAALGIVSRLGGNSITNHSAARPRQRPAATAPGGTPDAAQDTTGQRRPARGNPKSRASSR
jgi:hypothetical protein